MGHRAEALFSPWERSEACLGVREARLWLDDACLTRCLGLGPVVCEVLHAGPLVRRPLCPQRPSCYYCNNC